MFDEIGFSRMSNCAVGIQSKNATVTTSPDDALTAPLGVQPLQGSSGLLDYHLVWRVATAWLRDPRSHHQ